MKMISQTKNIKILVLFLVIIIFIFIFNVSDSARSLTLNILSPFFKTGNSFYDGLGQIPKFFTDKNKLLLENEKLLDEVEKSYLDIADYDSVKYENQKLREDLKLRPIGDFITASVSAKPPQVPLDSLFLDKGTAEGINNGDLVLAGERILIGRISKSNKNTAIAALNSFAGALSYGQVGRTGEPIEIKGMGGGNLEAKVPIDFDIEVGDKIMISGSLDYFTAVVGAIEEDRSSGFKNILMSLPVNISKVNVVFVRHLVTE